MTNEKVAEYFFRVYDDAPQDGTISAKELGTILCEYGQKSTAAELASMMNGVDADGNGTIDFAEFRTVMSNVPKNNVTKRFLMIRKAFYQERHVSDEDITRMLREADAPGGGGRNRGGKVVKEGKCCI